MSAEHPMGKIFANLIVTNRIDQANAENGLIPEEKVRSIALKNVLIDTGATTLCLPAEVIEELGLALLKAVPVSTATGISSARIFRDASISLLGREGTFECLELLGGQEALLGVVPLEAMGLEPDLRSQTLKVLPTEMTDTYLTIL